MMTFQQSIWYFGDLTVHGSCLTILEDKGYRAEEFKPLSVFDVHPFETCTHCGQPLLAEEVDDESY